MPRTPWEITREMFLSLDEVDSLLAHVRQRQKEGGTAALLDRLIIETLIYSGLRNSECCRLRLVDAVLGASGASLLVKNGKGEERTVYIPTGLCELLERYIAEVRPGLLPEGIAPDNPEGPLVLTERHRPFERTGLYRRVVRILTAAGLGERASVQLLRHTYGYLAYLRTGGNLLFVQRQLGHAHPMITSIYAQFVNESYTNLAERIFMAGPMTEASVVDPIAIGEPGGPVSRETQTNLVEEFNSEFD